MRSGRESRRFAVATPLLRAGAASGSSLGHGFRRHQWPSSLRLSLVALGTRLKVGLGTPAPPVVVQTGGFWGTVVWRGKQGRLRVTTARCPLHSFYKECSAADLTKASLGTIRWPRSRGTRKGSQGSDS